jgi:Winged helix DNA-binding domain
MDMAATGGGRLRLGAAGRRGGVAAAHHLTWEQALAWRMNRHRLVQRAAPADLVSVAGEICGLHAQVISSPELSLWARIEGLECGAVHQALWEQRTLVKLWAMRGTLHLLPSAELGVWISALGTFTRRGNRGNSEIDRLVDAVGCALDGRILTREALALAVEETSGDPTLGEWVRGSWGSYLKPACFRGVLCFGPGLGGRVRFTTPATWIPGALEPPDPQEGLRAVTRRFLSAYAPVTLEDLAFWWGDGRRAGARMLAALGEETLEVDVEGQRAWMLAGDLDGMRAARPPQAARLLPAFDPWVIGVLIGRPPGTPCDAVLPSPGRRRQVFSPQGWVSPVLLVDGRIAGTWSHTRKDRRLLVEFAPFAPLPAWARPQLEAEAERLACFLGGALSLRSNAPPPSREPAS